MKGFIEVHARASGKPYLVNINAIGYVSTCIWYPARGTLGTAANYEEITKLRLTCSGEQVRDDEIAESYETVKAMIRAASMPAFTVYKEKEE